ncbi:dual serine/threonine and tyrosine protein kinase-like isoform X3 [Dreissena polymorpha]|uniref:dual serine/threonine and tyrosine protein kinase-like isoform X3 n=1 Tax=Dreissena polymorpha TaxID=45954 RepID=UPI0022643795|nr:dual serine/threonine and tyrosine protein kinase-like isoform X3 [Dreissena polymorpha]
MRAQYTPLDAMEAPHDADVCIKTEDKAASVERADNGTNDDAVDTVFVAGDSVASVTTMELDYAILDDKRVHSNNDLYSTTRDPGEDDDIPEALINHEHNETPVTVHGSVVSYTTSDLNTGLDDMASASGMNASANKPDRNQCPSGDGNMKPDIASNSQKVLCNSHTVSITTFDPKEDTIHTSGGQDDAQQRESEHDSSVADFVENLTIDGAFDWLDERNIDHDLDSLDEMRLLIKRMIIQERNKAHTTQHNVQQSLDSEMNEILIRDRQMKDDLAEMYTTILDFVGHLTKDLQTSLSELYGDYVSKMSKYKKDLLEAECPIVVAGETSAGKSSFLNLLLGTDVLPYSLLCATSTICRVHPIATDAERYYVVHKADGTEHRQTIRENDVEALEKLKQEVTHRDAGTEYKCVDIYWQLPLLGNNSHVTIVDTPGVGECKLLSEKLFEYLPKAAAFIYVLNSANSGGVQEDRLVTIFNRLKLEETKGGLFSFDPSCTMFVCNKWDIVEERERNQPGSEAQVWQDTVDKLKKHLPGFSWDRYMYKMSTTEASRYITSGIGYTERYAALMGGLQKLILSSLTGNANIHYRWIGNFLEQIRKYVAARVNRARATEVEKKRLFEEVNTRLATLREDAGHVKKRLREFAQVRCRNLASSLFAYLHDPDVQARIKLWTDLQAPVIEADDFDATKLKGERMIQARIMDEITKWEAGNQIVKTVQDELTHEFKLECKLLTEECTDIQNLIEGDIITPERRLSDFGKQIIEVKTSVFTTSEKVILIVAAPLWIPVVTAASLLFLPVGVGMLIKQTVQAKQQRTEYMKDKAKYMTIWTEQVIEDFFKESVIDKFISETYMSLFESKIKDLCEETIPAQIKADIQQVEQIQRDRRSSKTITREFKPIQLTLQDIIGQLKLYGLKFVTKDLIDVAQIRRIREIGKGSFSTVYSALYPATGNGREVALKILTLRTADLYSQLTELECLRKLKQHEHIVEFIGVCYSDKMPAITEGGSLETMSQHRLMFMFEICDQSLEDFIFKTQHLQCGHYDSKDRPTEAVDFYVKAGVGIARGLAHIHASNFAHRDLKLANVLMSKGVVKVCDFGFAKHEADLSGTYTGTRTHMSPEILSGKPYTKKTDMYSLAIVLWELWYGRHAYSEDTYDTFDVGTLLDAIKEGTRPNCRERYAIPSNLVQLIERCWDGNPDVRPTAEEVTTDLQIVFKTRHST